MVLELVYRMKDKDACSIFWIPCTSYEAVEQAFMSVAEKFGMQDIKPAKVKESVRDYFTNKNEKWLLIFDNADDMSMWTNSSTPALKEFLPYNGQGHAIFTTRNRKLAVNLVKNDFSQVSELDRQTGLDFLKETLQSKDFDETHAIELLEQLTFLPLALTQATDYINANGIPLSEYLSLLQEQEARVVKLQSEDFGDDGRYDEIQNPVALTWLVSFQQVHTLNKLAAEYLSLMACISPYDILRSFLPQNSKKEMVDAMGLLSAYSFINIQPGNKVLTLHRLVYLATRNWLRKEKQFSIHITKAADRFNEVFPNSDHTNQQLWREYLPHALSLCGETEFKEQQEKYINFIHNIGACLYSDGRYNDAKKLYKGILPMQQRRDGDRDPSTLSTMAKLAATYFKDTTRKQRSWGYRY
ncbi:hypothetical protein BJX76DRAFT_354621 [Aspergillus varians]